MSDSSQAAPLQRVVGVAALGLNVVNLTVAAGIFGLPAIIAGLLGAQAILAYLVCAALFGLVGLCMAESGSRIGSAGGLYAYASVPFGPIVGGIAGTLLWTASGAVADAAIASLLVDTLAAVAPVFAAPWVRAGMLLAVLAAVTVINIRGVTYGLRLSITLTVIKIAPLALLAVGGLLFVDPAKLAWTSMPPLRSIGEASVVLFYAFFGFEAALSMSSEIIKPSRTVPRGIFLGLLIIAALYVGLQVVAQGTMGAALAHSKAPLVDVARLMFGSWGSGFMVLAVILSTTGCIAGDLMSSPRVLHAFAQQRQLPQFIAKVHPRYGTPAAAICIYAAVCALMALSGTFRGLATMASAGTLILYFICCLGVLRLRARDVSTDGPAFRVPLGPLIPVCACAIILWMLWTLSRSELSSSELWTVLAFIGAVGAAYAANEYRRRRAA
jgi:basic amino acid/polyamine antiporter, APA family